MALAADPALIAAFTRMGFSQEASDVLADPAKENLTIQAMLLFDDKGIKSLCAALRKPGGTIAGVAPAAGRAVPQIPDPGVYVAARAELSLTVVCFMAKHYHRTSRALVPNDITVALIQRFIQYKEAEDAYKEPDDALKLVKVDKVIDFIDEWPDNLALFNGQNGRPLNYVIRDAVAVPNAATDPPFGEVGTEYASLRDEITARADHTAPQYCLDNAKVFEMLNDAISEHKNVKTWIKNYAKARDGRGAWFAFKAHYRGSSEIEAIESAAEQRLEDLIYKGEMPRYNFETHVSMHRKSHLELEKATGIAMPETTKVRRLIKSLKASTMLVPIATIRAQDDLRMDFDATVNFLRGFISTSSTDTRNVAQVAVRGQGGKKGGYGKGQTKKRHARESSGNDKSLERWYKPAEWFKLDPAVRERIVQSRKKRKVSKVSSKPDISEINEKYKKIMEEETPGGSTLQRESSSRVSFSSGVKKTTK
jgi:hypothetical protein